MNRISTATTSEDSTAHAIGPTLIQMRCAGGGEGGGTGRGGRGDGEGREGDREGREGGWGGEGAVVWSRACLLEGKAGVLCSIIGP